MRKFSVKQSFALGLASVVAAGQAMAEVPTAVNTAITGAGTDAATIGGLVLVVIVGIAAFKYMRRAL